MPQQPTYLDDTGNPLGGSPSVYLNEQGEPMTAAPQPGQQPSFINRAIPTALRIIPAIGGSIIGGAVSSPSIAGIPAGVILGGGTGAGIGETAAQWYEKRTGQRQAMNPTQIATQTGLGMVPVGKVPGAGATAEQLTTFAATLPLRRGVQGAAFGAGSTVATQLAETGELPSARQVVDQAAIGGVLGAAGGRYIEGRSLLKRAAALEQPKPSVMGLLKPAPGYIVDESGVAAPPGVTRQTPPAQPDPSFVRSVPAEYAQHDEFPRRELPPARGYVVDERGRTVPTEAAAAARQAGDDPFMMAVREVKKGDPKMDLPADASHVGTVDAAIADREFDGHKVTRTIYSGDPNAVDAPKVNLTPEEARELRRIKAELETFPKIDRTFTEDPRGRGNAGKYNIVGATGGAEVYHDIIGGLDYEPGRNDVWQGVSDLLEGKHNAHGQRALELARRRLAGDKTLSRPLLPIEAGDIQPPRPEAGPPPFRVDRIPNLQGRAATVQERASAELEQNLEGFITDYRHQFDNVVSADNAKELFSDYARSPQTRGELTVAVHRPSAALAGQVFKQMVNEPVPPGRDPFVIFTAGGTGSGKSSSLEVMFPGITERAHVVYDSTLSHLDGALQQIGAARAANHDVMIVFTDRDIEEAFRSTFNADRGGRAVSPAAHRLSHDRANEAFETLRQRYGGDPNVSLFVVHNDTQGRRLVPLEEWAPRRYNDPDVERRLAAIAGDSGGASEVTAPPGARPAAPEGDRALQPARPPEAVPGQTGQTSQVDPRAPRRGVKDEGGFVQSQLLQRLGGGAIGAATGAATGEDGEDRTERAVLFGLAGAAAPSLLRAEHAPPRAAARGKAPSIRPHGELSSVPPAGAIRPSRRLAFPSLEKMPEPIREDLQRMLEQHGGFQDQRRNVQPVARTEARSERIAIPLEQIKPGTALNAEELAAYKNAVASVMTERLPLAEKIKAGTATSADKVKFSELTDRATVLVSSYRGAKAEAGRALNILRSKARVLEYGDAAFLDQLLRDNRSEDEIRRLAELAAKAGNDPVKQLELLRESNRPTLTQLFEGAYYNSLLSGVKTHLRNAIGNSFNVAANLATPLGAAPIDAARSKMTGSARQVRLGEIPEAIAATAVSLPQAFRDAVFTLQHGFTPKAVAAAATGQFDTPRVELPGGLLTNLPSRALEAADTFFRTLAYNQELHAGAYAIARQGSNDADQVARRMADLLTGTTPEALELRDQAEKFAARAVFQEKPGKILGGLIHLTKGQDMPRAWRLAMTFVAPFVKTPANILRQGLEASPAGFMMSAAKEGGRRGAQAQGRAALGTIALAPIAYLAATGRLSGNGPTDRSERAALMESGWRPNSVRVGDQWVQYQLFQPLSVPMAAVANAWERFEKGAQDDDSADESFMAAIAGAGSSLLEQSFLAGLNGLLDAVQDPERNAKQWLEQTAQGAVPASGLLRNLSQAVDPVVRDPRGAKESIESIIPGLSKSVPPRLDRFGREVERPGGALERGFAVPGRSPETKDPVNALLRRLELTPDLPRTTALGDLSRDDELAVRKAIGQERYARLQKFVDRPGFDQLPAERQQRLVENELREATTAVNQRAKALLARGQKVTPELLTKAPAPPKPSLMASLRPAS